MIDKGKIKSLSKKGLSSREVAELLGCSYQYVSLVLKRDLLGVDPGKASKKKYQRTIKGRRASSRASIKYARSLKGKETHKKYWGTLKGKETRKRYNLKRIKVW